MENNNQTFQYTYSAKEQQEIRHIRDKYTAPRPQAESKMDRLRRLDRSATQKAQAISLTLGILGTLFLGLGMSLIMTELLSSLGTARMLIGIPLGLVGILQIALAYPTYQRILKKERRRIAPEVLRLTDELMH